MPDPEQTPGPRKQDLVRRLARPALALAGVIVFQLLFASMFADVLQHPVLHQAPVAGRSPLAQVVSGHGGGTVRLAAEPTTGLQAALSLPGTLIAIITMVVSGDPAARFCIAAPSLASPWNVIGQGLPPSAALSAARGVVYPGGANLTGPLAVLAVYAAVGTVLTLAATAWRRHRPASRALRHAGQIAATAAAASLAA